MAQASDGGKHERFAVFSVEEKPDSDIPDHGDAIEENEDNSNKLPSRFKVEFVSEPRDFEKDKNDSSCEQENHQKENVDDSKTIAPPVSPSIGDSYQTHSYDTHNMKTFGRNTLETLPHEDHYRNLLSASGAMRKRPTLLELHEDGAVADDSPALQSTDVENGHTTQVVTAAEEVKGSVKFGWIKGVLVRCLLNIYGVMLFLRLSWVVGQAGIGLSTAVILLASVVTTITALSMSAICTNGQVRGGGAYFMISRSLGPEFGGAIGIIFSVANAVAVAMYIVGFAETIRNLLQEYDLLMIDEINDVRVIGLITLVVLFAIALIGMEWEARAQIGLLAILMVAIVNFLIGSFIPPSDTDQAKGFVGYRGDVFSDNMGPDFRDGYNFFSVFAIFFPAATGILAGANISGDLADASSAIPKGTLLAILISSITYIIMAWLSGACVLRDAVGLVGDSLLSNGSDILDTVTNTVAVNTTSSFYTLLARDVMQLVSAFGPITIAGIISATLSSALASLVSAPKVFQAVSKDRIFPGIHVFAKGNGKNDEPRRAYALTFAIAAASICIGDLNAIAPLISNFFLMSYALINYSCFDASLAKSPGWRPAFRYYSKWLSLFGGVLCAAVMFIMSWWTALITLVLVVALYAYVHYKKPDINWGSSTQAHVYRSALQHTQKLVSVLDHIKNFRPQVLVMTGFPSDRPALVDLASTITKDISLMICGNILITDPEDKLRDQRTFAKSAYSWFHKNKVKSFYGMVQATNRRTGAQALMQCCGAGKLRPNTVLLGFKNNWQAAPPGEVENYFLIIHDALDLHNGVGILRLKEGLDFSHLTSSTNKPTTEVSPLLQDSGKQVAQLKVTPANGSTSSLAIPKNTTSLSLASQNTATSCESDRESEGEEPEAELKNNINKTVLNQVHIFRRKQKGSIDVWWLFDDGGLTLLVPYLLSTRSIWGNCKLRVFMAGTKKMQLDRDQRHMATLLSRFRIEYSSMTVLPDIGKTPTDASLREFDNMISPWKLKEDESSEKFPWKVSVDELAANKDKTNRHIRLRELLHQYSSGASLIVMTLPMPRKGMCSSGLYMSWLDTLTRNMPPILLLRGNQDSVLTYYS